MALDAAGRWEPKDSCGRFLGMQLFDRLGDPALTSLVLFSVLDPQIVFPLLGKGERAVLAEDLGFFIGSRDVF